MKILVVAEKPSVGRDIAHVLQCKTKGEGCLIGEKYIVSWAIGHLITLCEPQDYDMNYKKWNGATLPIIPEIIQLKPIKKTMPQLKLLKKWMNSKEIGSIICATDSGREGELIFRYIYEYVKCKKPVQRLWISSMTDIAIKEGFQKLKESTEYDLLYLSAKCRSEADWLVGINATRAYTLKYKALLSIGRVQTPTLAVMVSRQEEIDRFESKDYYEVEAQYETFSGIWFELEHKSTKIFEKEKADIIAKKTEHENGKIEKIENEKKQQPPPLLYDLTQLQRECNKQFAYSAQKTLSIAQNLYEKRKLITYPRTDSQYLSNDMTGKIQTTLKKLASVTDYQAFTNYIFSLEKLPLSKRIINNAKITDHHAIIPTDTTIRIDNLTQEEKNVYHFIVLRFFCVFYPQYIYTATQITVNVKEERFLSKGITINQLGWKEVYKNINDKKDKKEKEEQTLPSCKEGQAIYVKETKVLKKKTMPPPQYTENTLLSAMENVGRFVDDEALKEQLKESGLGTPATRAAIIERLIDVGYIIRKGKNLVPTQKAMQLIQIVPEQLKSPQTTGKWEKGLSSIEKGIMTDSRFMDSIKRYVYFLIQEAETVHAEVVFDTENKKVSKIHFLGMCPVCHKGKIYENSKSFYCSQWKEGCTFTIWKNILEIYGVLLNAAKIKKLLKDKKIESIAVTLPQTKEKCKADIFLKENGNPIVELRNITRI